MTREEAIYQLRNTAWLGTHEDREKTEEAVEMAISALEQEPKYRMAYDYSDGTVHKFAWIDGGWKEMSVEPYCEDAISREAVLRINELHHGQMPNCINHQIWEEIKQLPPVTPSRRKGHWIDYSDEGYVECPYCEHATNCEDNIDELHYCFWCGAEMVKESSDADNN